MKKLIAILMTVLVANSCCATDMNDIIYGVRSSVDAMSEVNKLREQIMQINTPQEKSTQVQYQNQEFNYDTSRENVIEHTYERQPWLYECTSQR